MLLDVLSAGGVAGIVILTRANMAGLMFTLPIAIVIIPVVTSRKMQICCALILAFFTMVVVSCYIARNWHFNNQLTISTNSYYNLYVGNKKVYQEDLNLLNPFATKEQKEFRLRMKGISSPKTDLTLDEMRKLAIKNIIDKPLLFLRRALGRLARIFVPKTEQLQLVGGESSRSVFSLPSIILLIITNLQWGVFLVFGFAGLLCLKKLNLRSYALILAIILGSIPFCLVAVSKPRYSFPFDPLLIFCTCLFVLDFKNNWSYLWLKRRRQFLILMLFFAWAWIAWLIFAFSSRLAL